jgi:hypothetical protein
MSKRLDVGENFQKKEKRFKDLSCFAVFLINSGGRLDKQPHQGIKLLKTKRRLLNLKTQFVLRRLL